MSEQPRELGLTSPEAGTQLRQLTPARIALGRSGRSVSTGDHLAFQLDHAAARDAVQMKMNAASLADRLRERRWPVLVLQSCAEADDRSGARSLYLQRPDLGRRLSPDSAEVVRGAAAAQRECPEVVFAVADGLSALAVERNALPLLDAVQPLLEAHRWRTGPVCVVSGGRVAVGDEIGELLGATLAVMLIGERPGLSAADSLGLYLTWEPRVGRADAERNCISNVRFGGLSHTEAAELLLLQMDRAKAQQLTGVNVKGGPGAIMSLPSSRAGSGITKTDIANPENRA